MTCGLLLAWYFHLPVIAGDDEVVELWTHSLEPLLRTHGELNVPANVAITGTLLERLSFCVPDAIDVLRSALAQGTCEMAGTTYHEIAFPLLPVESLRRHLEYDCAIKADLLGVQATAFYPGSFGWTPLLPGELCRLGYRSIILDSRHLEEAMKAQSWRWGFAETGMTSVMLDTAVLAEETHQLFRYSVPDGDLLIAFRSWPLIQQWTFGNIGLLHAPWETTVPSRALELRNQAAKGVITIADDGDRINPVSLANYRLLLEMCRDVILPISVVGASGEHLHEAGRRLSYLPTFILGSLQDFWLSDADASHYQLLLSELRRHVAQGRLSPAPLMELEDVFPVFWKNVARKRWYFDRIANLLEDGVRDASRAHGT